MTRNEGNGNRGRGLGDEALRRYLSEWQRLHRREGCCNDWCGDGGPRTAVEF